MNRTKMHIAKSSEQACCTCAHWTGIRLNEGDGHVYALESQEGICGSIARMLDKNVFHGALTLSSSSCLSWGRWAELEASREYALACG